jgi:hypothetical protein
MANPRIDLLLIGANLIRVTNIFRSRLRQARHQGADLRRQLQARQTPEQTISLLRQLRQLSTQITQLHRDYQSFLYRSCQRVEDLGFEWPEDRTILTALPQHSETSRLTISSIAFASLNIQTLSSTSTTSPQFETAKSNTGHSTHTPTRSRLPSPTGTPDIS